MPDTTPYTVQLEDGSVETFQLDNRIGSDQVPRILEGAVRARTRQKAGQPPAPPAEAPPMFGSTISENVKRAAVGAAEIPVGAVKNLFEGGRFVNQNPATALGLLPEIVQGPIRNAMKGMPFGSALGLPTGVGTNPNLTQTSDPTSARINTINAIPVAGPAANEFGARMGEGQGPEAIGNLAGNVALGAVAARGAGNSLQRIMGQDAAPANIPLRPQLAGNLRTALSNSSSLSPQIAGQLRKALADVDLGESVNIKLPVRLAGMKVPLSIELTGPRIAAARALVRSASGSTTENFWAQRLLAGAIPNSDQEDHTQTQATAAKLVDTALNTAPGTMGEEAASMLGNVGTVPDPLLAAGVVGMGKFLGKYGGMRGFVSKLGGWVEKLPQAKFSVDQFLGQLKSAPVPKQEVDWLGLEDWLSAKGGTSKVTKDEIKQFIDQHQIQLQEQPLAAGQAHYNEPEYKTPGGRNYREVLIKYPLPKFKQVPTGAAPEEIASGARPATTQQFNSYQAGHFGDQGENLLAHARVQDFRDTEGGKVLLVDEVQSDWHREGRKLGYNVPYTEQGWARTNPNDPMPRNVEKSIPNAPFKGDWHELMMKTMLRDAVEKGYDKLAWSTGKMQQDRWDLTRFFPKLKWTSQFEEEAVRGTGGAIAEYRHKPSIHIDTGVGRTLNVDLDKLEDYVGQSVADHIRQQISSGTTSGNLQNVKSGGEWAENLYDRAIPNFMKQYTKKWGGTVEKTTIMPKIKIYKLEPGPKVDEPGYWIKSPKGDHNDTGPFATEAEARTAATEQLGTFWSIRITPEMRKSIESSGQPLFSIPLIGPALLKRRQQQEQQEQQDKESP